MMDEMIPFDASTIIVHLLSAAVGGIGFLGTTAVVLGVLFEVITFEVWQLLFPALLVVGIIIAALNMASMFSGFSDGVDDSFDEF